MVEPRCFFRVVDGLKDKFFTAEEFPFVDRKLFPRNAIASALQIPDQELEDYAEAMGTKEIEALLLDFKDLGSREDYLKISGILLHRLSNRFFRLFFSLYQFYFEKESMRYFAGCLAEQLEEKGWKEGLFLSRFVREGLLLDKISSAVNLDGRGLDCFFEQYGIQHESALAMQIGAFSLKDAGPQIFGASREYFLHMIQHAPLELLKDPIEHYLMLFDVKDYFAEANKAVQQRFGDVKSSLAWTEISKAAKEKFEKWLFLSLLVEHTREFPKKRELFTEFASRIIHSSAINEASALILDFGNFVIADFCDLPFSHLYAKDYFEKEMRQWNNGGIAPSFFGRSISRFSARDFIIELREDSCFTLYYEGVDLFYAKEMLEIKTGMEPDMRKQRLG